ncbi:MAG: NUDIX hydrolase [Candidatus Sungiibacteriota bacterium]|uniref:NUDIX hydrolase n=1 Tax=Candidatus Sungiibacteriota bacterium TaxID=2750080 RepID=A0A7T5RJW2_9BACT|nr:MAG: NUDIX hydrolase [Candidatus Sungbacteria bacterium]
MPNKIVVLHTDWFDIESEEYPNLPALCGKPIYRLNVPQSVVLAVFTEEGKMVLVRQFRPVVNRIVLELPAGGIKQGESPLEAAQRELLEETGYVCSNLQFVGNALGAADRINDNIHVFFGRNAKKNKGSVQAEEGIEVLTATPSEFIDMFTKTDPQPVGLLGVLFLIKWRLAPPELSEI